ncbi:hypothetical protein HanXRQr2_Chr09g0406451 [Helianthus annuus]|uniref:Uncharacterized protein n=1 Tax=Helianthus annuus TaxID=4232 RepID=A0A9K3I911_HELAN|nr:hypothetical protein HanXRQr2_Chr09g0406451 [Helianthus annuus]KAJ0536128.1 hypothetical protein HanIR_Chr09g0438161 [Helianthus annuus]KAJ0543821.1 hypothetical protein HanHA89_Chr09g0354781 [Helianthus annuus]KAJ0708875.1 hypothetical protein HanLR1_Chr09g0334091 [Helianthus annuus]
MEVVLGAVAGGCVAGGCGIRGGVRGDFRGGCRWLVCGWRMGGCGVKGGSGGGFRGGGWVVVVLGVEVEVVLWAVVGGGGCRLVDGRTRFWLDSFLVVEFGEGWWCR